MKKINIFSFAFLSFLASSAFADFKGKIHFSDLANLVSPYKGQLVKVTKLYKVDITTLYLPNGDRYAPVTDDSSTSPNEWSTAATEVATLNAVCELRTISMCAGDTRGGGESCSYCIVR